MTKKKRKSNYKAPKRVKVGRCWYVVGYDKKPIVGLSWDSGNGYYFPTHFKDTEEYQKTGKRPHFTKEYDNAIMLYRQWQEKETFTEIDIPDGKSKVDSTAYRERSEEEVEFFRKLYDDLGIEGEIPKTSIFGVGDDTDEADFNGDVKIVRQISMPEPLIVAKAKELFAKYPPSVIAEKFGMPSLAKIDYVDDLREPYTLKQISDCYFNKVEFAEPTMEQKRELSKVEKAWGQFCKTVSARTAKELTKEEIKDYYNDIFKERKRKKYSSTWMKGRFERIKRIFNNAVDELDDVDDIITARGKIGSVLKAPKSDVKEKPHRIPREHFHVILEHSNIEERCMWLLSMNLAYYSVDVARMLLSAINFEDKTVVFRRGKTGKHRSGVLWDITIEAIREYQDVYPHNSETLFLNRQNNVPYLPNRIRKKFVAVIEKAELRGEGTKRLCHRNFRDSLKSIGVEMGVRDASVNAAMGHHTKHDEYVDPEVFPKISEEACVATYEYYFGKDEKEAG